MSIISENAVQTPAEAVETKPDLTATPYTCEEWRALAPADRDTGRMAATIDALTAGVTDLTKEFGAVEQQRQFFIAILGALVLNKYGPLRVVKAAMAQLPHPVKLNIHQTEKDFEITMPGAPKSPIILPGPSNPLFTPPAK